MPRKVRLTGSVIALVSAIQSDIAAKKAALTTGRRVRVNTPILRGVEGVVVPPAKYMLRDLSPDCLVLLDGRETPLSFYQHEVDLL